MTLLAEYVPFIYSLQAIWPNVANYWLLLLLPLVMAISVVYKGTKVSDLRALPRAATWLTIQIFIWMALAGAGLWGATYLATHYL